MRSWTKPLTPVPLPLPLVSSLEPTEPKDPGTKYVPQAYISHLSTRVSLLCIYKSASHHASQGLPSAAHGRRDVTLTVSSRGHGSFLFMSPVKTPTGAECR